MIALLRVELTRLRWRRAISILLLACVAIPVILLVGYAWSTRPLSDADIADAKRQAAADSSRPWVAEEIELCQDDPENYLGPGSDSDGCVEAITPTYENYLYRQTFEYAAIRTDIGAAAITILTGALMLIGTTFAGHDWSTGSMSNQLLFEPRRLRVWWAKALAVAVTGAVVGVVVLAIFWGVAWLIGSSRDVATSGVIWREIAETQGRGVLVIALGGLLGYALTMLWRSTVATLSLMFGVSVAGSIIIINLLGEGATRWLLPTNYLAFVLGGFDYYDESACARTSDAMMSGDCMSTVSTLDGGLVLGVIVVLGAALSLWSFQRRDVP